MDSFQKVSDVFPFPASVHFFFIHRKVHGHFSLTRLAVPGRFRLPMASFANLVVFEEKTRLQVTFDTIASVKLSYTEANELA